jgi:hypothetical protein
MLDHLNQKNLLSSSFLVLSLFLLSPEGKAMKEENEGGTQRNFNKPFKDEIILSNVKSHVQKKLNIPFINGDGYKTLPMGYVSTYDQRSKLYSLSGAQYPKIPMIHRYDSDVLPPPFGAAFLGSDVSIPLSLKQYLGPKDQFFFLNIQQHDENDTPLSLKPQYALFPEAPATSNTDHVARVGWTVVPGREGKIIPAEGETKQDLLKESVYIHPSGHEPNPLEMVLSKDVMHLQGISTNKSMDCYSFIDADNANLVTYHWMLTPDDFMKFNQALSVSNTLNELILNLDYQRFLPKLLMELGKYVNYFPQIQPHVQAKLNVPFMSGESQFGDYKNLPMGYVPTYDTRSNLNSLKGCYPKISTIHTDNPDIESPPFGAAFLGSDVSIPLSLKQHLPQKDQFFFLNIQQHDKNDGPLSLKPQYALFPDAPASSQVPQDATVGWTVIPGRKGNIIPEQGEAKETLWKEAVSIHPAGENDPKLILSGNSMRLQGINTKKSMDCYSFIDADNANLVTYHWMLTPHDFRNFSQALSVSDTLNELIHNLDKQDFLPELLRELKRYVYYYPQHVQEKLNKPFMGGQSQFGNFERYWDFTEELLENRNEKMQGCVEKLEEKTKYTEALFPNGTGEITRDTENHFLEAFVNSTPIQMKFALMMTNRSLTKGMHDETRAKVIIAWLTVLVKDNPLDEQEFFNRLNQVTKYVDNLFPKGIGKVKRSSYFRFMEALLLSAEEQVKNVIRVANKLDINDQEHIDVISYFLLEENCEELGKAIHKINDESIEKINNLPTFLEGICS